jgi:hypothetical protein
MYRHLAAIAALALAAACSQAVNTEKVLVDRCVSDGSSQEACECVSKEAHASLDEESLKVMVLGAEQKHEEAQALMQSLPLDKQLAFGAFAFEAIDKCGISSAFGEGQ